VSGPPAPTIRLLIVDDHPVVRDGLSGMFSSAAEVEVVGEAGDGEEAIRLAAVLRPDVILMDLRMPGMDGVAAITELTSRGDPARVLVLTTYDTDGYVLSAIEAGATGYLLKDAPRDELLRAVRAAARGDAVLAPSVAARLMSKFREPGGTDAAAASATGLGSGADNGAASPGSAVSQRGAGAGGPRSGGAGGPVGGPGGEALSQRELEILELVASGTTNREAAARLYISEATVKTHLLHIYAKLGVNDRAAAVAEGYNRGLLTLR
jgi:DNA-binding NarL/FixJ family response regulator